MAVVVGTQVVPMTPILEGYWSWRWIDKTAGASDSTGRASAVRG
jgi:hypothetical protein